MGLRTLENLTTQKNQTCAPPSAVPQQHQQHAPIQMPTPTHQNQKSPIRVKLIARGRSSHPWARQTPGSTGLIGDCQFIFDREEKNYHWLVVIDDLSRKLTSPPEKLACPDQHTIMVTTEPPTITRYGKSFASQFHTILTSQDSTALPHQNRIHSTTGNLWFHGKTYDQLTQEPPPKKDSTLSTVCSSKQQKHTIHQARYDFTQWLKEKIPHLEIYGHGVRPVEKKHQALDSYSYHLAIENHIAPHHWTEKFSDPILSHAIPIYHGCPNLPDYFPQESYLKIDIENPQEALALIQAELSDPQALEKRQPYLAEARRLILEKHNMLAILAQHITTTHSSSATSSGRPIYNRKQMRLKNPTDLAAHLQWKTKNLCQTLHQTITARTT